MLHDGPPYATGAIHYGTVLNKVLKDIVVRSQLLMGKRAVFRPGWDCHGLPIEQQVEKELGPKARELSATDFRSHCERHALKFVDVMRTEFKRLGCLGNWDDPYLTLSKDYEAAIARQLAGFARAGLVYRDKKPVHWCLTHHTALAEAEVEYEDHASPSIYVRFPVVGDLGKADARLKEKKAAFVIWTTTPWTLPANLAIVANPELDYVAIPHGGRISDRRGRAGRGLPGGDRDRRAEGVVDRDLARRSARAGRNALRAAIPSPRRRSATRTTGSGSRATPRSRRAPGSSTRRPATAPTTTSSVATTACTIFAPVDENGRFTAEVELGELNGAKVFDANPKIVEGLAARGLLLNKVGETLQPPVPLLLALQETDHLPRHAAVVRAARRGGRREIAAGTGRSPRSR